MVGEDTKPWQIDGESIKSRRQVLSALASAGIVGLAGCGNEGGGESPTATDGATPTSQVTVETDETVTATVTQEETETDTVESGDVGGTLTIPISSSGDFQADKYTWIPDIFIGGAVETELDDTTYVDSACWDDFPIMGRWSQDFWWQNPGPIIPRTFSEVEFMLQEDGASPDNPNKIRYTIREDANWSDGEPIRALDGAGSHAAERARDGPLPENPTENSSARTTESHVRMPDGPDGKVYVVEDQYGYMDNQSMYALLVDGLIIRGGVKAPSHLDPWNGFMTEAVEQLNRAGDSGPGGLPMQGLSALTDKYNINGQTAEEWSNPDNVVCNGAWQPAEVRGAEEIILEPNPHHWNADSINFDQVRALFTGQEDRKKAQVASGELDWAQIDAGEGEIDAFAESMSELRVPAGGGGISMTHTGPFNNRDVRAALAYALNAEEIANTVHSTKTEPVTIPGFHSHWIEGVDWVDESWADENLIDYSQDIDRANQLMQNAGFSKNSDGVWQGNGTTLEYELPTTESSPTVEQVIAEQLSNFGVNTQVQVYDEATFSDKSDAGDFKLRMGSTVAGAFNSVWTMWFDGFNVGSNVRNSMYFDQKEYMRDMIRDKYNDREPASSWVSGNVEWWEPLTFDLPPVGDPDGSTEPFAASYVYGAEIGRGQAPDSTELKRKFLWTANWFLPDIPLFLNNDQIFINDENWNWPTDDYMWDYVGTGWSAWNVANMLSGRAPPSANPDDPPSE